MRANGKGKGKGKKKGEGTRGIHLALGVRR